MIQFNVIHVNNTLIFSVLGILKEILENDLKTVNYNFHAQDAYLFQIIKDNVIDDSEIKLEKIVKSTNFMGNQFDIFNYKIDSVLNELKT